ncbi:DUF1266 domain-containing protein [Streptomyces sp. NPDC050264]|uniref:DUF1266 domain-containing protein n=1 Tax=Streptomyces sp. NPDC050264 TaxID=3155038 RepID=UPI00343C77D9
MTFGPPPADFDGPSSPQPAWTAPSPTERALYEAKNRGDWTAYYETLASVELYMELRPDKADVFDSVYPLFHRDPRTGGEWLHLYTTGMLPAPDQDHRFEWAGLNWFATASWATRPHPPTLVINPGTPCEAVLPPLPPHNAAWMQAAARAGTPRFKMCLRALHVGGALHGPVAHGLALGALLSVTNGEFWNTMAHHGEGYQSERQRLREWWGVTSRQEWQERVDQLLSTEQRSNVWEFALDLRHTIARDFGGHVDTGYWKQAVTKVLRARAEPHTVLTEDGVTTVEPRPAEEVAAQIEGVHRLIGRITRYEARMRADGLLAESRYVTSVDAWDLGRAPNMARWGLAARYGTLEEAESAVRTASALAARSYRNWQDFSAAYALGRCLHFDDEEFGKWYEEMVSAHQILTEDPGSPWLNIPFKKPC